MLNMSRAKSHESTARIPVIVIDICLERLSLAIAREFAEYLCAQVQERLRFIRPPAFPSRETGLKTAIPGVFSICVTSLDF